MAADVAAGQNGREQGEGLSWPRWMVELLRTLAVRAHFVISGNIRDVFLTPTPDGFVFLSMISFLHEAFSSRGLPFVLVIRQG